MLVEHGPDKRQIRRGGARALLDPFLEKVFRHLKSTDFSADTTGGVLRILQACILHTQQQEGDSAMEEVPTPKQIPREYCCHYTVITMFGLQ